MLNQNDLPTEAIKQIAARANCVGDLLAVIEIIPEADRRGHLQTCLSMAEDVARDLAKIVGGCHA